MCERRLQHSHLDVVLDEVENHDVVADLGEVHGCVLVFGGDVAVCPVLQQQAHHVSITPLTCLGGMRHCYCTTVTVLP